MQRNAVRCVLAAGLLAGVILTAGIARGTDALDRYLTNDLTAVASVDLTKFDILAAFDEVAALGVVPQEQIASQRETAAGAQRAYAELPKLGARRAYVLVRPSDLQHGGTTFVIELTDGVDAAAVVSLLTSWLDKARTERSFGNETEYLPKVVQAAEGVVLGASDAEQMKLLTEARPVPREDAAAAVAALKAADAGIVAFGDADSRRVVREMFPQLPEPFADIDGALLADGLKWLGVTIKLPPEPTVGLTIYAATPAAGKTLQDAAERGVTLLKGLCIAAAAQGEAEAVAALPMLALLKPDVDGLRLSITLGDDADEKAAFRDLLAPALQASRESARRSQRMNNLKQIALGMFNYHDVKGSFPAAASYDANGKPLLSWRVMILPFVEQQELYNQFHLDEPWDSDHNRTLIAKMPRVYADPSEPELAAAGRTTYVVPTGEGLVFGGREGTKLRAITDGTSNTIMAVEVIPELAVVWTKPDDWDVDLSDPLRGVKRSKDDKRGGVFAAAFCDGSVRMINNEVDPMAFKAILTPTGEETVQP